MVESESTKLTKNNLNGHQCQHFVIRKKRLCRMTVRPGRQYCGEHEPHPKAENGKTDERIPCPNDPKHTCYASKLEKHLTICNARPGELPPYIVPNINAPAAIEACPRIPLNEISREKLMLVINKINSLYDKHIKDHISTVPERPIHSAVLEEFTEADRTESSLRHLRQASQLLWLAEDEGLVQEDTCYVELGAGKGQLSYYAGAGWCAGRSRVLLVERASLRHKRDNRLRARSERLRADLAHLALPLVPLAARSRALVGLAKHLCGVATDYALRCMTADGVGCRCRGLVLATCCHHRCERAPYTANNHLQELGINGEELNAMLGIVSWATCGTGRSRERRAPVDGAADTQSNNQNLRPEHKTSSKSVTEHEESEQPKEEVLTQEFREQVGRKAKAILDWGRVLYLREKGFEARLCHYVPASVSLENVCIVARQTRLL